MAGVIYIGLKIPNAVQKLIFYLEFVGFDDGSACRYSETDFLAACAQDGLTALMYAAAYGHAPVVEALLGSDAAVDLAHKVRKLFPVHCR